MEAMQAQLVFSRPGMGDAASPSIAPVLKAKEVAPFLKNLRRILEDEPREILRWTDDGKAFEIHDLQRMMDVVLPKYFKHGKYTSFQRQLNYFNFRKWTKSKAVVCTFSNPFFVRDQPSLAWRIHRKKSLHQNAGGNSSSSPSTSPVKKPRRPSSVADKKHQQMLITVPSGEHASGLAAYPSPTDAYSFTDELGATEQELDEVANLFADSREDDEMDSLDWVDALYSSLDAAVPSFQDHALEYCAQV